MTTVRLLRYLTLLALTSAAPCGLAQSGTLLFQGTIAANSCAVHTHAHGAPVRSLSPTFTVDLPTVGTDALTTRGQTAGWSPFVIRIGQCGGFARLVRAHFEPGTFVDPATGRLDVDAHSSARNVQIALREQGSARHILIGAPVGQQGPTPQLLQDHAMLVYEAGYYALGQASPGSVRTSVEYNLVYH